MPVMEYSRVRQVQKPVHFMRPNYDVIRQPQAYQPRNIQYQPTINIQPNNPQLIQYLHPQNFLQPHQPIPPQPKPQYQSQPQ